MKKSATSAGRDRAELDSGPVPPRPESNGELAAALPGVKAGLRELAGRVSALEAAQARRSEARGGGLARYHEAASRREKALAPVREGVRAGSVRATLSTAQAAVAALMAIAQALEAFEDLVLERLGLAEAEEERPRGPGRPRGLR